MSGFYESKSAKKTDYESMVTYLKNDRPLTSSIRRKNYKLVGRQNIKGVRQYRNLSEKERMKMKEANYEFYMSLLRQMEKHGVEELPLSGKLIEVIRNVLESNYIIQKHHLAGIAEIILEETSDPMSESLLKQC